MRITEYPEYIRMNRYKYLLTDGDSGTKYISTSNAIESMLSIISPKSHRMTYRGKHLGDTVTSTQRANIQNGSFDDLWLGDYWRINGVDWLIVDFDYWYNVGDTAFTQHHLVIMPDAGLYIAKMNSTNTTSGGYVGSEMYKTNLEWAKIFIKNTFGSALLTHRELLCNAFSDGKPSGVAWYDSTVDLPNEVMMYGSRRYGIANSKNGFPLIRESSKTQLALFMIAGQKYIPAATTTSYGCWLRDPSSSTKFTAYGWDGIGADTNASSSNFEVRPVFAIG